MRSSWFGFTKTAAGRRFALLSLGQLVSVVGSRVGDVQWPVDTALVAIVRDTRVISPSADDSLEAGDELLFVAAPDQEPALEGLLTS